MPSEEKKEPKIILALDIDGTLFNSWAKEIEWIHGEAFWKELIDSIAKILREHGIELTLAIITSKSGADDLVFTTVEAFLQYIMCENFSHQTDVNIQLDDKQTKIFKDFLANEDIKSSLLNHIAKQRSYTLQYHDANGQCITNRYNGHYKLVDTVQIIKSETDAKEDTNTVENTIYVLNIDERLAAIREVLGDPNYGNSDDDIHALNDDVLQRVRETYDIKFLTKTDCLEHLGHPAIIVDDRRCIVEDAETSGFGAVQVSILTQDANTLAREIIEQVVSIIENKITINKDEKAEEEIPVNPEGAIQDLTALSNNKYSTSSNTATTSPAAGFFSPAAEPPLPTGEGEDDGSERHHILGTGLTLSSLPKI
jgi:hydroxymethylpyrimidine pyrophosphatase-like HAD family hydrolase